jgi:hypothetical protein
MTLHPAGLRVLSLDYGQLPFDYEYKDEERHQTISGWISDLPLWRLQVAKYLEPI